MAGRRLAGALLVALALSSAAEAPPDDGVFLPPLSPNRSAWRLYVHDVPWDDLGVSDDARRLYEKMMARDPPPAHDEGGLYRAVVTELPRIMPRWQPRPAELDATLAAATERDRAAERDGPRFGDDVLFLLPLSPYHLCQAVEHGESPWGPTWAVPKGSIPVSIQSSMVSSMRDGLTTYGITCKTYERALQWLYGTAAWRLFPERHVFGHVLSHALREALRSDLREQRQRLARRGDFGRALSSPGAAELSLRHPAAADTSRIIPGAGAGDSGSWGVGGGVRGSRAARRQLESAARPAELLRPANIYPRMGLGIIVTAEDRRFDWLEAAECGHVVHAPYYSPPFFLYDQERDAAGKLSQGASGAARQASTTLRSGTDATMDGQTRPPALVVESGPPSTSCHRFDNRTSPKRWACPSAELRSAAYVRKVSRRAMTNLALVTGEQAEARQTRRGRQTYANMEGLLKAKAAMYAGSTFCLVLAGDSAITTRIFSIVQSLCIPVFVFDRDFLPFPELVRWKNFSLRVRGEALIAYNRRSTTLPNPLLELHRLKTERPEQLRAMQAEIERTRWHLTYHRNGRGVDIAGAAERPSAGEALVHHLISAAAKRQALARVTGGDAGAMLRCVDERLRRHDLTKAGRRRK